MQQPVTFSARSLLLALALGASYTAWGQTYTPVPLTGLNHDVIAEGTGAATTLTTADVDNTGGGFAFMSANYVNPSGAANTATNPLPNNGLITSAATATPGLTFQLAGYGGNNVLRVPGSAASNTGTGTGANPGPDQATVGFATATAAGTVYVLATGGGGALSSSVNVTFTFTDGTTQAFTGQSISDWFTPGTATVAYRGFGRVGRTAASPIESGIPSGGTASTNPNLYQLTFALTAANATKPISSITFGKTSTTTGVINVFAVTVDRTTSGVTACSGAPTPGTATSSSASVCPAAYFTLGLTGASTDAGLAYQWQYSTDNTTWTNLPTSSTSGPYSQNANAVTCVVTGQAASTYYRCQVSCGTAASTSAPVQVTLSPATGCYCTPPGRSSTSTSYTTVSSVSLPGDGGATLSNAPGALTSTSPGYVSANYAAYPASVTTTTLTANGSYTLTAVVSAYTRASVWVDFDRNGAFDASEFFILRLAGGALYGSATTNTLTATITPPVTAAAGDTRLRLRVDYYGNTVLNTGTNACTQTTYGQTMDYTVTLTPATPCAGAPAAPVVSASATSVCGGAGFTLSAPTVAGTSGLSYQWQSSPAGAGTFTNLGAAQASPTYAVASITASTDYRLVVTCTNGTQGNTATSNVVSVALGFLTCYCSPVSGATNEYIKSVALPGQPGFTNATNAASTSGYGDFTTNAALTTSLTQGSTYTNGVTVIVRSNNTNSTGGMWIDFDHSGTFDASEFTALGTSSAIATDVTLTVTLVVPQSALLGQTRVRVRWRNSPFTSADACVSGATTWYGETEDYYVTIVAPTTCTAPPASITAGASVSNACANAAFTLSTSSVPTTLGGYTYQWQSRTGTGAFADIAGATTNPYTVASQTVATDYRLVVGCQYGGTPVTSNVVSVGQNDFSQCYCAASSTNPCSQYGVITNVTLGSLNNASACATPDSYSAYLTQSTDLTPGRSATLTLGVAGATATYTYNYGVWIDLNHNGTFDASEFLASSASPLSATSATITLAIPALSASVLAGPTRLRIRTNAGLAAYGLITAGQACGALYNGETEDYVVNVLNCTSSATATFSYSPVGTVSGFCTGAATSPTATLAAGATAGIFTASPAGLTINATTGALTLSSSTPGTYTVTNSVAGSGSACPATATTSVTIYATPAAPTITPSGTAATGITLTSSATTGNQWYLNGVAITGATGQTYLVNSGTRNGSYTVVTTSAAGCASAASTAAAVTVTGVTQARAAATLTLAPNPTPDGHLSVSLGGFTQATELSVYNALGQRVRQLIVPAAALSQPQALDLSALAPGVYMLHARSADGALATRRLVRE